MNGSGPGAGGAGVGMNGLGPGAGGKGVGIQGIEPGEDQEDSGDGGVGELETDGADGEGIDAELDEKGQAQDIQRRGMPAGEQGHFPETDEYAGPHQRGGTARREGKERR